MTDWSARQYLRFEDERTRPSRDLLAQVPLEHARSVIDLGCGPGNSTELLVERYPQAEVCGLAVFQWVPDHTSVLRRLVETLPAGGVLAVQMPDNTSEPALVLMQEVAGKGPWAGNAAVAEAARGDLPRPESYYDLLKPLCTRLDIWHTIYNHVMDGPQGLVEWFKGSALRPFLAALDAAMRDDFLAAYLAEVTKHYGSRFDGQVLLRFPRLFIVVTR